MTSYRRVGAVLAAGVFTVGLANAAGPENDPKVGMATYYGTGSAERAPEYAELQIDLAVACRTSAEDVAKAIDAESAPIWKAIAEKVPTTKTSETDRSFWTSIVVNEAEGSRIEVRQPNPQNNFPGTPPRRIDVCTGKVLPLEAAVPTVYGGRQRLGIRSADLDWVEALARALNERPQNAAKTAVKVTHQGVRYDIKADTKRAMYEEVLGKAREAATGAGSQFESDKKTLKFASAHFRGHQVAFNNPTDVQIGDALAKGQAPKVTLKLPLVYTVYAEAADLVPGKTGSKGLETSYEIQGSATVDADYATTGITVGVNCQAQKEDAAQAIAPASKEILDTLTRFQGDRRPSETDRIVDNEASQSTPYYPYLPIRWNNDGSKVTGYLDLCTQRAVNATASGRLEDMPAYYQASRAFQLNSSRFAALLELVETLRNQHVRPAEAGAVRVAVSPATAQVLEATKQKLMIAAREQATKGVLDPNGPLASDARAHKFLLAHLKSVRPGMIASSMAESAPAFGAPAALQSAPAPGGGLDIRPIVKPNERRPVYPLTASFLFQYEFVTENYVEKLAAPAPIGPMPLAPLP